MILLDIKIIINQDVKGMQNVEALNQIVGQIVNHLHLKVRWLEVEGFGKKVQYCSLIAKRRRNEQVWVDHQKGW